MNAPIWQKQTDLLKSQVEGFIGKMDRMKYLKISVKEI